MIRLFKSNLLKTKEMNILILHSGSRSLEQVAEKYGHNCFSVDIVDYPGTSLVKDIEFVTTSEIPFIPDMIWCSRDCKTYSIAAIKHHRRGQLPVSEYAKKCDRVNINTNGLIDHFLSINPNLHYYLENPRGMMRKMDFMKRHIRTTITYCSYGDDRMKPTDIWSNNIQSVFNPKGWNPRPICHNGNTECHHQPAPRGSRTGTQGKKGSFERSRIPLELFEDIFKCYDN
jgi:hypothetical protein